MSVELLTGEEGYLSAMRHILKSGYESDDRTGTGTIVSPHPIHLHFHDVDFQYPLFTTKYVSFRMLAAEMLWFVSGSGNAYAIKDHGSKAMSDMWLKWSGESGDLGPVYGVQARYWKHVEDDGTTLYIDQLQNAIDMIRNNPESRRIIVNHWNVGELHEMVLPPCHMTYQFTCEPMFDTYKLHLHLLQRSADMFLGVPFNIAGYSLLLNMIAEITDTVVGDLHWTGVNCHIYNNHLDAVREQVSREVNKSPSLSIPRQVNDIDDFKIEDFDLINYLHHPAIRAEVSV